MPELGTSRCGDLERGHSPCRVASQHWSSGRISISIFRLLVLLLWLCEEPCHSGTRLMVLPCSLIVRADGGAQEQVAASRGSAMTLHSTLSPLAVSAAPPAPPSPLHLCLDPQSHAITTCHGKDFLSYNFLLIVGRRDGNEAEDSFSESTMPPPPSTSPSVFAMASTHGRAVARGLGTMCVTSNV